MVKFMNVIFRAPTRNSSREAEGPALRNLGNRSDKELVPNPAETAKAVVLEDEEIGFIQTSLSIQRGFLYNCTLFISRRFSWKEN
jgi:hypothetical protein